MKGVDRLYERPEDLLCYARLERKKENREGCNQAGKWPVNRPMRPGVAIMTLIRNRQTPIKRMK